MREDYTEKYKFDIVDEEPETASRLVLWVWPVLGILAIAAIVVTVLQSPWILDKAGLTAKAPMVVATKTIPPPVTRPVKQTKKATSEKASGTKEIAKPAVQDIAKLQIEISRIADTLKAINTALKAQNSRLTKLESTVGTVTGSIPRPKNKAASSSQSKTANAKTENQVKRAQKADLLASVAAPAKARMDTSFAPVSSTTTHQDTGEARAAAPAPVKLAAVNTTNVPGPAIQPMEAKKPKQQYAIKLARARTISRLAKEWQRLIRGKAAELSVLEPHIMPATTSDGKKAFDLIAGPFAHMADAIELCARLKIEGIKCKQAKYGGKPL